MWKKIPGTKFTIWKHKKTQHLESEVCKLIWEMGINIWPVRMISFGPSHQLMWVFHSGWNVSLRRCAWRVIRLNMRVTGWDLMTCSIQAVRIDALMLPFGLWLHSNPSFLMWILASQHSLSFLSTLVLSLFLEEFLSLSLPPSFYYATADKNWGFWRSWRELDSQLHLNSKGTGWQMQILWKPQPRALKFGVALKTS